MDNSGTNAEYLSASGFKKLKDELSILKDKKRKEIAERLEYAKSLGDLSENAEYQEAKEEQQLIEERIIDIEDILSRAVLISHPAAASTVSIGSTVVAKKELSGKEDSYFIVGREESDPAQNRISNESPLGQALIGRQKGDTITVLTPKGAMTYKILDIQ